MFDTANPPAETSSGDGRPKPDALIDHLLIVRVIRHSPDNPFGLKRTSKNAETGEDIETPADCIIADVVDLDAKEPVAYYDYVWLQARLIAHFKTNVGKTLVGILGKHPDVGQRKGPYYFTDQSQAPRNMAAAKEWADANMEFFTTQAPGKDSRKGYGSATGSESNGSGGTNVYQNQHEDRPRTTLEAMRNNGGEVPF